MAKSDTIKIRIPGTSKDTGKLPGILDEPLEKNKASSKKFLPSNLVTSSRSWDLTRATRSTFSGAEQVSEFEPEQLLAIELDDGLTVFTRADSLAETLRNAQSRNQRSSDSDDELFLDDLRDHGQHSRGFKEIVSRIFALEVGTDDIIEDAKEKAKALAREKIGEALEDKVKEYAELGVTRLGTKALMWAVEKRMDYTPGLYQWTPLGDKNEQFKPASEALLQECCASGPILVFIHGTASSTEGSFGDLGKNPKAWKMLQKKFAERIFALEHYTLSESPIENALALAQKLPARCRLNIISHSRGGLIGDLLCLQDIETDVLQAFRRQESQSDDARLDETDAEDQENLTQLLSLLKQKSFQVERYARVACPARGTRLASGNFDAFLSMLLKLIGLVPFLAGQPIYYAFKRVVLEIAKNRTNPALVPGLEAMVPGSPYGALLARAKPVDSLQLGIVAGDIEGGGLLKRLGIFFTDQVFFDNLDNDLVVDTDSMYTGIARHENSQSFTFKASKVSHFNYFENENSRTGLLDWVRNKPIESEVTPLTETEPDLGTDEIFVDLPIFVRSHQAKDCPVVIVLPGTMGSHLVNADEDDLVWLDPGDILRGKLSKIRWQEKNIVAKRPISMFYGEVIKFLAKSHRVEPFPYDWRLPLDQLGKNLHKKVKEIQADTDQPIRFLAHSMGGLVVRSMILQFPDDWEKIMQEERARFIMLGTPNHGSYKMVETLLGKSSMIQRLASVDLKNDLQDILDIIAQFPGALQLLPNPGFESEIAVRENFYTQSIWKEFDEKSTGSWFRKKACAQPDSTSLKNGKWLWTKAPALPECSQENTHYIFGIGDTTPCGIKEKRNRLKMVGTHQGDGTVTWKAGKLEGIKDENYYYLPAAHGDLLNSEKHFPAILELLETGETQKLSQQMPRARGEKDTFLYDIGPEPYPSDEELIRGIMDGSPRKSRKQQASCEISLSCKAMDLRYVKKPILVGHYQGDVISGAEAIIDQKLMDGELTRLNNFGLYAGPIGSSAVAIPKATGEDIKRRCFRGAIVAGLGEYDGLNVSSLTNTIRLACIKFLLEIAEQIDFGDDPGNQPLTGVDISTLLLGYNSTASLTVEDSVNAILRGVMDANCKVKQIKNLPIYISGIEFIELYIDTAITITHTLSQVADRFNRLGEKQGLNITANKELQQGKGYLNRLSVANSQSYWPRLVVTNADKNQDQTGNPQQENTLGEHLRFIYLGERARAETVIHQRQPEVIERMIEMSVNQKNYNEQLSRTLFQLLVPHDFKEAARQIRNMLLVVDHYTANLPWELLIADDEPMAIQTPVVRQLSSLRYRINVQSTLDKSAYVIGNPSTEGFAERFTDPAQPVSKDPDPLQGAEDEAITVVKQLEKEEYQVIEAIGQDQNSINVINKLYQQPYRIVHIAAHGMYDVRKSDGKTRTGVVLSDGLLLTAAEISAMEIVPNLVFLNCCHLGKVNRGTIHFNRLAYSISRELIEIGVNAVVVAGWAVDDQAARVFAEQFYQALVHNNQPFGAAIFKARRHTYEKYPYSNTWGAYQAYGDPMFRIAPENESEHRTDSNYDQPLVATEELLYKITQTRNEISNRNDYLSAEESNSIAQRIRKLMASCPEHWLQMPHINAALGDLFAELGSEHFSSAREFYENAIYPNDQYGLVPIKAIEQLANLESREGEAKGDMALIDSALKRLTTLLDACSVETANSERMSLMGSAYKRKAALLVNQNNTSAKVLREAISDSVAWYKKAENHADIDQFDPYPVLNRLALEAVLNVNSEGFDQNNIVLAQKCYEHACDQFQHSTSLWDSITIADATLTRFLINGELKSESDAGEKTLEKVLTAYEQATARVVANPKVFNSVSEHIRLLALLFQAQKKSTRSEAKITAIDNLTGRLEKVATALTPAG